MMEGEQTPFVLAMLFVWGLGWMVFELRFEIVEVLVKILDLSSLIARRHSPYFGKPSPDHPNVPWPNSELSILLHHSSLYPPCREMKEGRRGHLGSPLPVLCLDLPRRSCKGLLQITRRP